MAPSTPVRTPLSFVRRAGPMLQLQLQLGESAAMPSTGRVRLINGGQVVEGEARISRHDAAGQLLKADIYAIAVKNGRWLVRIALGDDPTEADFTEVAACVLVATPNPISLLLGKPTAEELQAEQRAEAKPAVKHRAAAVLGRAADRVLSELPPAKAQTSRRRLRHAARRLLP